MEKVICICASLLMVTPALANQCNNLDVQQPLQPCAYNDWDCIRCYFAGSQCSLQTCEEVPDELYVPRDILLYPYFNMTGTQTNVIISGINSGEVVSFIVDYQTDIMQITTRFTNLTIEADSTINYFQPNAEPIKFYFPSTLVNYSEIYLITLFNCATAPDLRNSFTMANSVVVAVYDLGICSLPANQPPVVQELIANFRRRSDIDGPEGLLARSAIINECFLQRFFCDFGIDVENSPVPIGTI